MCNTKNVTRHPDECAQWSERNFPIVVETSCDCHSAIRFQIKYYIVTGLYFIQNIIKFHKKKEFRETVKLQFIMRLVIITSVIAAAGIPATSSVVLRHDGGTDSLDLL